MIIVVVFLFPSLMFNTLEILNLDRLHLFFFIPVEVLVPHESKLLFTGKYMEGRRIETVCFYLIIIQFIPIYGSFLNNILGFIGSIS
uniref:Uncharacterized protein n=1 Tax=Lactuca sativa TaxID=4236 RepID=A0A9R1VQU1_LACSA|nr:hypothetical protein LSAT_V11C400168680 [Lactuca sativa]